jgi:aryl-alcohol dehydrogenase-like predicted oxidoreductase
MTDKTTRRNFLLTGAAVAGGIMGNAALQQNQSDIAQSTVQNKVAKPTEKIPERVLGRTQVQVPIFGLGGAGQTPLSWEGQEKDAVAIIEKAIALGIRYFDTAANYGPSEDYFGKVLPYHRKNVFLASKTDARDRDGAWRELERSLKRLNTEYLDLWQMHHVSFTEDLDTIFARNGAIQAVEAAKAQKLIRFAGITGHHDPNVIAEGLRRYSFDTTLIPVNAADKHHPRPFLPVVLPVAKEKNVGVIAMKVPAYGRLFKPGGLDGMNQALGYAMSQPGVHCCVVAAETIAQLEDNFKVAQAFQPLSQQELTTIEQRTAAIWEDNTFFRAWT